MEEKKPINISTINWPGETDRLRREGAYFQQLSDEHPDPQAKKHFWRIAYLLSCAVSEMLAVERLADESRA